MVKLLKTTWIDEFERADELIAPLGTLTLTPEISLEEIQNFQSQDPAIAPLLNFLANDITPDKDTLRSLPLDSRNLWSQRPSINCNNGILIRYTSDGTQLVVPDVLRQRLFESVHSGPLAAHLGSERMLAQLRQHYYWPGMRRDIRLWCLACPACQQSKGPPARAHGKLQKVLTAAPLDIVAIDILSGLPIANDGNKHILVITDYFTKWSEAYPLPDSEASTCMNALYNNFF